jgi:putative endonuclease
MLEARKKAYLYGLYAEILVCIYLIFTGYKIIKWRYKTKVGEIDILARKQNFLVCVEVKARKREHKNFEYVTNKQIKRIKNAALFYQKQKKHMANCPVRFDLVIIRSWFKLQHLKSAW